MKLSVIVPVYNEKHTILEVIRIIQAVPIDKEIVLVDDGSTDGTRELVRERLLGQPGLHVVFHEKNAGKGRAIRTGIQVCTGDAVLIQDADLEYDPSDYPRLLSAMQGHNVNVVYGSRFLNKKKVTAWWHRGVNYFLTGLTNVLYGSKLTDMETCYKLFRAQTIKKLDLRSDGFEIEAELSAKILKSREKIIEIPVAYKGRSYHEGKKIGWKDGLRTVAALFYYRFSSA